MITPIPSLLDRTSSGGQVAVEGFVYQEAVLLARLPQWLAEEGFTRALREGYSDLEVQFFVPGQGFSKEYLECKNHQVNPTEFWDEVAHFQQMDAASPTTYRRFELVCNGLSAELLPLFNALQRVRSPGSFYADDPVLMAQSIQDYTSVVINKGGSQADAEFLLRKVEITPDLHVPTGATLFREALPLFLPQYQELPYTALTNIIAHVSTLLGSRINQPYERRELETAIDGAIPGHLVPPIPGVVLYTASSAQDAGKGLRLEWADLFGGESRTYPKPDRWDQALDLLRETRDWITQHRRSRLVRLEGSRRLSAAIAIGATFSAVTGYTLEMNHRGSLWPTSHSTGTETPAYSLEANLTGTTGEQLVVVVDILRDTTENVRRFLSKVGLADQPMLVLHGNEPVVSAPQANRIAGEVKQAMSQALQQTQSRLVHLFYAGPSHLALFLGRRLNATAPIQCYEWTPSGDYVPTFRLRT
jgi:hypothetical protein